MAKLLFLLFSLLTILISLTSATSNPTTLTMAHTELTIFGFPIGLLPRDVSGYSINRTSGEFAVTLSGECKITLPPDNYLATYSKTVRGKIVKNKIAELDGIRVWAFFKWWYITGIKMSGDDLTFEVGFVSAKYPAKNFDLAPSCEGRRASS